MNAINVDNPRIQFKNLKGFPEMRNKIETVEFLKASQEIVAIIETFGKLFIPVIKDMNGNIKKLTLIYEKDKIRFHYLDDLIVLNVKIDNAAGSAILWLNRALQLICQFFENILNDNLKSELLKTHLQDAYNKTLKPYHGWFVQNTVKMIYHWIPSRTQLIGTGDMHDENIKVLNIFLPNMRSHLDRLDDLLTGLDEGSIIKKS